MSIEDKSFDDIDAMMETLASGYQSPVKSCVSKCTHEERKKMAKSTFEKRWLRDVEVIRNSPVKPANRIRPVLSTTDHDRRETLVSNERDTCSSKISHPRPRGDSGSSDYSDSSESTATESSDNFQSSSSSFDISGDNSDTDSDDEDVTTFKCGGGARQLIPQWAKGYELIANIDQQFNDASEAFVDPSTIFKPVPTCNLEDVFKSKNKTRIRRERKSTGKWSVDQLTIAEMENYREEMGYASSPVAWYAAEMKKLSATA